MSITFSFYTVECRIWNSKRSTSFRILTSLLVLTLALAKHPSMRIHFFDDKWLCRNIKRNFIFCNLLNFWISSLVISQHWIQIDFFFFVCSVQQILFCNVKKIVLIFHFHFFFSQVSNRVRSKDEITIIFESKKKTRNFYPNEWKM